MSATSTQPVVQVENLSRSFRGKTALEHINLQIPTGCVFGLVGLNGAGKTTLIRHLIGSYKPQTGSVRVLGQQPSQYPERVLKRVGYLTEEDSLPKWMRVSDLLGFTRSLYPTWDTNYAQKLCRTFELRPDDRLKSLSKGQRARVGLLVAIAHRPELLILDEPSSGLDPIARGDILEAVIRTVSEDGRTVLFSSHLLDEVDRVCDTVALLHHGSIAETITIEQLETQYEEIILTDLEHPPRENDGTFGWKQSGREWSAVRLTGQDDSRFDASALMTRPISLQRWFAARVSSDRPFASPETPEVAIDG